MTTNKKNDDIILTIGDAIAIQDSSELSARYIRKLAAQHSCFIAYASAEVKLHLNDFAELGSEWAAAFENFCLAGKTSKDWFRRKHPQAVRDILTQATKGLRQLDPRFGEMTLATLDRHPELVYMGLVQLLVQHEAKHEITRHHRRYLVIQNIRGIAA